MDGLQTTLDGSRTLYSERYGQTYGSHFGARTQAEVVFLRGSRTDLHPAPTVLEVGFGLGQNFRVTLQDARRRGAALTYLAYEFDPVRLELLQAAASGLSDPLWARVLDRWGQPFQVSDAQAALELRLADVTAAGLPPSWASAIYLDGFSPQSNPEVWTPEFLVRLAGSLTPDGVLATYSSAGRVRRALTDAGLRVERRPGPPGKREHLIAARP